MRLFGFYIQRKPLIYKIGVGCEPIVCTVYKASPPGYVRTEESWHYACYLTSEDAFKASNGQAVVTALTAWKFGDDYFLPGNWVDVRSAE